MTVKTKHGSNFIITEWIQKFKLSCMVGAGSIVNMQIGPFKSQQCSSRVDLAQSNWWDTENNRKETKNGNTERERERENCENKWVYRYHLGTLYVWMHDYSICECGVNSIKRMWATGQIQTIIRVYREHLSWHWKNASHIQIKTCPDWILRSINFMATIANKTMHSSIIFYNPE